MNSISRCLVSIFYDFWFNLKLSRIRRIHRPNVVKSFDLADPKDSFWIECGAQYVCAPQNVEEHKEFDTSLKQQTQAMMKSWEYFDSSTQNEFVGLLKYVAWLRMGHRKRKQYFAHQGQVSDHIYEM